MNLYPVSQKYAAMLNELAEPVANQEQWAIDTREALQGELEVFTENGIAHYLNQAAAVEALKQHIKAAKKRLKEEKAKQETRLHNLTAFMQRFNITAIETPLFTAKFQKNPPSTEIYDAAQIPAEFIKTKTTETIDKTAIKAAIKDGREIPGAKLSETSYRLTIK